MREREQRTEEGRRLKAARIVAGLSQQEVAKSLGKHWKTVGRWERGESPVQASERRAVAAVLRIPESDVWQTEHDVPRETVPPLPLELVPPKVFGANVERRRLQLGMAPGELRPKLKLPTVESVAQLEAGRSTLALRRELLPRLVRALKTTPEEILSVPRVTPPRGVSETPPAPEGVETLMSIVEDARRLADRLLLYAARTKEATQTLSGRDA